MSRAASPTLIGAFVIGGIALLVGAIAALGGGALFRETIKYVAYFDGSVKGLAVGSPVRFRGASVGAVTDIRIELMEEQGLVLLPVIFELHQNTVHDEAGANESSAQEAHQVIKKLIDRGLRARLGLESIVTAQLYIELDFAPEQPAQYLNVESEYPQFPTTRSPFAMMSETLLDLPIQDLANSLRSSLEGLEKFFNSPDLRDAITSVDELTHKAMGTLEKIDGQIAPLSEGVRGGAAETAKTMKAGQEAFRALAALTAEGSPLRYQLATTLQELAKTASAVRDLADYLQRHPEALVYGKGQERRR